MPDDEAQSRWEDLHNHVTTQTAQAFVTTFLNRCVRANTEHTASLDDPTSLTGPNATGHAIPVVTTQLLTPRYRHSEKRVVLVDFEGTLWRRDLTKKGVLDLVGAVGPGGERELPKEVEEAVNVLAKLADDRKNEVWLLSGLRVKGVLEAVAEKVPKVGIV